MQPNLRLIPAVAALCTALSAQFVDAGRSALPRTPSETKDLFVADLNQDGVPDIVVSDGRYFASTPRLVALLSDGRGRWLPTLEQMNVPALGIGDADGDGDVDLFFYGDRIGFNANGAFTVTPGPGPNLQDRAVLADFDQNGSVDVVPLPSGARGVAFDADGDGDLDLCATTSGAAYLELNQAGTLTAAPAGSIPAANGAVAIAAGDVDGDGDEDLVLGTFTTGARLLLNQGNATFVDASQLLGVTTGTVSGIALGDVDGDGLTDVVLGTGNGGDVLRNTGSSFAPIAGAFDHRNRHTQALALADFDLDGDLDLVQGAATGGPAYQLLSIGRGIEPRLLWNDGTGTFRDGARRDLPGTGETTATGTAAMADMNGDDVPDLVVGDTTNAVLLNDGAANFAALPQPFPASGLRPVLEDLDGDGDVDAVLYGNDTIWTMANDGTGNLSAWQGPYTAANGIADVEIGDLDGDGTPDLFVALLGPGIGPFNPSTPATDEVWLGQGNGGFALASGWLPAMTQPSDVALGDLDGDGDLDVLDASFVLLNQGASFTLTTIQTVTSGVQTLALGDVDGDGDLDGVIGARCYLCGGGFDDPWNGVLLNDGAGSFTGQAWPQTNYQGTYSVAIGDLDGDGDDDVLFGNGSNNEHQDAIVRNLGGGQWDFVPATQPLEQEDTHQVLLGDLDRDGDLDYVAINAPDWNGTAVRSRVYLNHARQLAAPLPPRVGRDYDLELHGAPLGAGVWLSLQPANVPTTIGVLGLGPAGFGPLTTLPAPSTGSVASQSFVLPNVPALAGITLYLQAIDFGSLRLSNTLHETFVAW